MRGDGSLFFLVTVEYPDTWVHGCLSASIYYVLHPCYYCHFVPIVVSNSINGHKITVVKT